MHNNNIETQYLSKSQDIEIDDENKFANSFANNVI